MILGGDSSISPDPIDLGIVNAEAKSQMQNRAFEFGKSAL